jgi:imidazolonepropionase-like amidohydrolase
MCRSWLCAITLAVLAVTASSGRAAARAGQSGSAGFVITHVRVFDGHKTRENKDVVVADGLIRAVADNSDGWRHLPKVDGAGATLLPGLIDAHTHTKDVSELQQALRFGVTTVLDMFTRVENEQALRSAAVDRNDVADFRSAGILATAPRGHPTQMGIKIPTVSRAADADAFVGARKAAGADYLKIVLNGVRARDGIPTLDQTTTEALVHAAHVRGMLAVAHVETTEDVRSAVSSGVDGLVHVWRKGGAAREVVELVARRKVFVVPTLATPDGFVPGSGTALATDPRLRPFLAQAAVARLRGPARGPMLANIDPYLTAVRSLRAAGVRLLAGSDVPNATTVHGVSLHRELELLVSAGLSPAEALTAATANAAAAFRLTDRGNITAGARADLVLVRGDPTRDITSTRDILHVWRSGVEFERRVESFSPP